MTTAIQSSIWRVAGTSAVDRLGACGFRLQPKERLNAAIAQARPVRLGPDAWHIAPAALALHARRLLDLDLHDIGALAGPDVQGNVRHDEEHGQERAMLFEQPSDRTSAS